MMDILNSGVGIALVTGVLSIIGIAVAEILRRQHKAIGEVKENSNIVREQTQNSHKTNLRDDIDRVLHGIDMLTEQMNVVRLDTAWERRERMDLANRLERHLETCAPA